MFNTSKDTSDHHDYHKLPLDENEIGDNEHFRIKNVNKEDLEERVHHDIDEKSDATLNKLKIVSIICLVFMILEVIGGYFANSIAIMSDAAHLLSDFLGFIISIVSIYISRKRANHKMSFGYHRAEVIGALVSVCLIWGLTIWLLFEASYRLVSRDPVNGLIMLITAVIGFLFNVVMGLVLAYQGIDNHLHHHHSEELEHGEHEHHHEHGHVHHDDHHEHPDHKEGKKHSHKKKHHHEKSHGHHDHDEKNVHKHSDEIEIKHHHELTVDQIGKECSKDESQCKQLHSEKKEKLNNDHKVDKHKHHSHSHDEKDKGESHHGHHHGHSHENLNLKASLIHVLGDAIQNLGVVCAGLIIYFYPEYSIADPICTFIFSIIVGFTTIRILKEGISVLMEATPVEIDLKKLEKELQSISHVVEIHDLHVWSLSPGKLSLSCHLISSLPQDSLKLARNHLKTKYKITHSTIQVELESGDVRDECSHDLHDEF